MAALANVILYYLKDNGDSPVNSLFLSQKLNTDHQQIVGAIKSLQSSGNLIEAEQQDLKNWKLTSEGENVADNGSYEALVFYGIPPEGINQKELMGRAVILDQFREGCAPYSALLAFKQSGEHRTGRIFVRHYLFIGRCGKKAVKQSNVGFSKAMSAGWIYIEKKDGATIAYRKVDNIIDEVQNYLLKIKEGRENEVPLQVKQELKKRKLLQEIVIKSYIIKQGSEFTTSQIKQETDLTSDMIASGSWKDKTFKPYNFSALGILPDCGHRHPLMKVRSEFRQIFLEMGFTEMPTNNYVESSFWNFDALYQPQQHPARDQHDTFFVSDPQYAEQFPMDYLEKVKTVHSIGGYGSQGYKYDWKLEEAKKNLLRTHTTAVSARMLYALANQESFSPAKYFSIDKVFRNETLDATHLAEFHQIEGVIADYGLTLGDLIGVLHQFFKKLGIEKLRFKPAYNPYTEPSMEIFSYHEGLKKWVEVGNSGMFRPEMLLPMGLPDNVSVIAWGLSLERPTMIKYKIDNIRELVGHRLNLNMVNANPICRLDK